MLPCAHGVPLPLFPPTPPTSLEGVAEVGAEEDDEVMRVPTLSETTLSVTRVKRTPEIK